MPMAISSPAARRPALVPPHPLKKSTTRMRGAAGRSRFVFRIAEAVPDSGPYKVVTRLSDVSSIVCLNAAWVSTLTCKLLQRQALTGPHQHPDNLARCSGESESPANDRSARPQTAQPEHGAGTRQEHETRNVRAQRAPPPRVQIRPSQPETPCPPGHCARALPVGGICPRMFLAWSLMQTRVAAGEQHCVLAS